MDSDKKKPREDGDRILRDYTAAVFYKAHHVKLKFVLGPLRGVPRFSSFMHNSCSLNHRKWFLLRIRSKCFCILCLVFIFMFQYIDYSSICPWFIEKEGQRNVLCVFLNTKRLRWLTSNLKLLAYVFDIFCSHTKMCCCQKWSTKAAVFVGFFASCTWFTKQIAPMTCWRKRRYLQQMRAIYTLFVRLNVLNAWQREMENVYF